MDPNDAASPPSPPPFTTTTSADPQMHPQPLDLRIRFSHSSLPDISLPLPLSAAALAPSPTINNLKARVRAALPPAWRTHGLKLICGGRVLDPRADAAAALRAALPPGAWPSPQHNGKGKGKGKARAAGPAAAVYVHCALTPAPLDARALHAQLALEAAPPATLDDAARRAVPELLQAPLEQHEELQRDPDERRPRHQQPQTQQPQGFDRLLAPASGFSAAEVEALRAQFRGIIGSRYTPDTMPGGAELRRMEEAWLEDSSVAPRAATAASASRGQGQAVAEAEGGAGEAQGGYMDDDAAAALDDTFYGVFVGFFWPLGACVWGLREEGVWSRRRGWAVLAGVMVNVGFGVVRVLS